MDEQIKHKLSEVLHRITPNEIKVLLPGQVFAFGGNLCGKHGKGAAKQALSWGAIWGKAAGIQGRTYSIPTKGRSMNIILSVNEIKPFVDDYIEYAIEHPELIFLTTEIGCGLSKYKPKDIAPLFEKAIEVQNIYLPERFWHKLGYIANE